MSVLVENRAEVHSGCLLRLPQLRQSLAHPSRVSPSCRVTRHCGCPPAPALGRSCRIGGVIDAAACRRG
jgi:hypothetical protein